MRKNSRRILVSMMLVVLSFFTMIATTFAWIGMISNSTFDQFSLNLKENEENGEYGIQLSLSGKEGSFADSIDPVSLKAQLLVNMGKGNETKYVKRYVDGIPSEYNEQIIEREFSSLILGQVTNWRAIPGGSYLYGFTNRDGTYADKDKYFEFDLYVALYSLTGEDDGDNFLDVYLRESILESDLKSAYIVNEISFPTVNPTSKNILSATYDSIKLGTKLNGHVSTYAKNACRIAIQKYKSVEKEKPNQYLTGGNNEIQNLTIYQSGEQNPKILDADNSIYDFGGCLPEDYNFAWLKYNSTAVESAKIGAVPTDVINRGDVTYADDGTNNHIIDETDKVTTNKMIKLKVSFWFEGWDADCYEAIDRMPVSINLSFSNKSPKD